MSNRSAVARLSILFRRLAARMSKRSRKTLSKRLCWHLHPNHPTEQLSADFMEDLMILLKILPKIRERSVEW